MRYVDHILQDVTSVVPPQVLGSKMPPIRSSLRSFTWLRSIFSASDGIDRSTLWRNLLLVGLSWVGPLGSTPSHVLVREPRDIGPGISHRRVSMVPLRYVTHRPPSEKRPGWSISRSGLSASTGDLDVPPSFACGSHNRGCNSRYSNCVTILPRLAVVSMENIAISTAAAQPTHGNNRMLAKTP